MRREGMVVWSGGPPQELQDSHYYDVVVGNTVGGWSHLDLFRWAKDRGARTVEVMHSVAKSPTPPDLVDAFIGLNTLATNLNSQMKNRHTIYGIVDVDAFFQVDNPPYIGRLSRLVEEKRPFDFIRIAERYPNEKLSLAGDGPLYSRILSSAPLNVFMPGMIRDFVAYYSLLRLFVYTTTDDCCSVAVAMAMAAGVPCVVQDHPSLRETTGGNAVFCTTLDGFISEVGRFLNDPVSFSDMAHAGQEWVRQRFAPKIVVAQWQSVFDKVVSS